MHAYYKYKDFYNIIKLLYLELLQYCLVCVRGPYTTQQCDTWDRHAVSSN